jgi:hypothetical protein
VHVDAQSNLVGAAQANAFRVTHCSDITSYSTPPMTIMASDHSVRTSDMDLDQNSRQPIVRTRTDKPCAHRRDEACRERAQSVPASQK